MRSLCGRLCARLMRVRLRLRLRVRLRVRVRVPFCKSTPGCVGGWNANVLVRAKVLVPWGTLAWY
jgi:hypothetical protein